MHTSLSPHGGGVGAHGPTVPGTTHAPMKVPASGSMHVPLPHWPQAPPMLTHTADGTVVVVVPGTVLVVVGGGTVVVVSATGGPLTGTQRPPLPHVPTTARPPHVAARPESCEAVLATASVQAAPVCWQQRGVVEIAMSSTQPAAVQKPGRMSRPPARKQFSIGPPNSKQPPAVTQHAAPKSWTSWQEAAKQKSEAPSQSSP